MVCHGGSGTVVGGLAAGLPMVVVPLFADQPDNARCVAAAGLGLSVARDDPAALASAIMAALGDEAMRARCAREAEAIRALPTVDEALDHLLDVARDVPRDTRRHAEGAAMPA
jgi:UDP:flavonoid glycosyltransferase YjiC (YdhE family)